MQIVADNLYRLGVSLSSDNRILTQFASNCCKKYGGGQGSLNSLSGGSSRNRENRSHRNRRAAQISLKALGVGTRTHIRNHFVRGHYGGVDHALRDLQMDGLIIRAQVVGEYGPWHGEWYIHRDDVPLLYHLESGWSPRTVLLSPFDNLICDRARTLTMWGFDYMSEIYLPKSSRKYGYYVMPILHGDSIVGRIDPRMDRKTRTLIVNAVYAEEGSGCDVSIGWAALPYCGRLGALPRRLTREARTAQACCLARRPEIAPRVSEA